MSLSHFSASFVQFIFAMYGFVVPFLHWTRSGPHASLRDRGRSCERMPILGESLHRSCHQVAVEQFQLFSLSLLSCLHSHQWPVSPVLPLSSIAYATVDRRPPLLWPCLFSSELHHSRFLRVTDVLVDVKQSKTLLKGVLRLSIGRA